MTKVLVTGGTGVLGREVVSRLRAAGCTVRIMSRQSRPASLAPGVEWAQAQLETAQGLDQAVVGIDVIVHAASSPFKNTKKVDVEGTQRLLEAARRAAISHVVYISIVGIDRIPSAYYRSKLAVEGIIQASGIPWTILRATQFHDLVDTFFQVLAKLPVVAFVPTGLKDQPVAAADVAVRLAECALAAPAGMLPDIGGPEVFTAKELFRLWLEARGIRRVVIPIHLFGALAAGFRRGDNTCPEHRQGKTTWEQWLHEKCAQPDGKKAKMAYKIW
ncbi:MAG: SDR family oxidoreductase [Aggregatilineales bacterium]